MKSAKAMLGFNESLMDTLPGAIDSAGRRDRSRRNATTPLLRRRVTASDCPDNWNAIYNQLALDALRGRSADDELAGLMPTIFERVDALGIHTSDADRRAGQLQPLRAA